MKLPALKNRFQNWAAAHPAWASTLLLMIGFSLYVQHENLKDLKYDSWGYWQLAEQYWSQGDFHFMLFDNVLRGYLFPLLLSVFVPLSKHYGLLPMDLFRFFGAGIAAVLFGVVAPGLWGTMRWSPSTVPVSWSRRLLFGALGYVFWRGYFNYPLTDFPSVLALAGGLWTIVRGRSVASGLLAGLLVAAAVNFRPVYAASLPFVALLCLWPRASTEEWVPRSTAEWFRRLAVIVGIALVMWPQSRLNRAHFGVSSPFVLTTLPSEPSLYLAQLQWGLILKKYETNIGSDYPSAQMSYPDRRGQALWAATGLMELKSYAQYGHILLTSPGAIARIWAIHLFNGLDLQYPTPYVNKVYESTWGLALLNYSVLFGGIGVLFTRKSRWPANAILRTGLVLVALLVPCLATLPVVMECRFLLPLHLLLLASFAFETRLSHTWRVLSARQMAFGLALYAGFVAICFALSMNTQSRLALGPRYVFEWQERQQTTVPW